VAFFDFEYTNRQTKLALIVVAPTYIQQQQQQHAELVVLLVKYSTFWLQKTFENVQHSFLESTKITNPCPNGQKQG
jgi:hypothetical protein